VVSGIVRYSCQALAFCLGYSLARGG
jgi:hypothetical protein